MVMGIQFLLRKRSHVELNTYYNKHGAAIESETTRLLSAEDALYIDEEEQTTAEVDPSSEDTSDDSQQSSHQEQEVVTQEKPTSLYAKFAELPGIKQFLSFMNPPLWAMLLSVIVASTPLQRVFFQSGTENGDGSFIHNTMTEAILGLGSVSIPLILIVLGSNLYPAADIPPASKHCTRMLFGSLMSRMILPPIILLPIIAACVKYINISILDDPIFLIVAFILTISPPAIN